MAKKTLDIELKYSTFRETTEYDINWAKDKINQHRLTSVPLVELTKNLKKYRDLEDNIYDHTLYNTIFGGSKDILEGVEDKIKKIGDDTHCPIIYSLLNVFDQRIININHNVTVRGQDEITKNKKSRIKEKILGRKRLVYHLNMIKQMTNSGRVDFDDVITANNKNKPSTLEVIQAELTDNVSLAMAEEAGALKDSVEMAHEMSINQHIKLLEIQDGHGSKLARDIRQTNCLSVRLYTNRDDGMLRFHYFDPTTLQTNAFFDKFGNDITGASYEFDVTFNTYIDMVGYKFTDERNKELYGKIKGLDGDKLTHEWSSKRYINDTVKLGYAEFVVNEYNPTTKRYLEVTKCIYYVPTIIRDAFGTSNITPLEVLDVSDLKDSFRYGENFKKTKTSFIVFKDNTNKVTFMDIVFPEYEKINVFYKEILNTAGAYMPSGYIINYEAIKEIAQELTEDIEGADEAYNSKRLALKVQELVQQFKARGFFMQKTKGGVIGDDTEQVQKAITSTINNGALSDIGRLFSIIMTLYGNILISVGINKNSLGQEPAPRTGMEGVRLATLSSTISTKKYQMLYERLILEIAQRVIFWDKIVVGEFNKDREPTTYRARFLNSLIGEIGVDAVEVHKDLPEQDATAELDLIDYSQLFMRLQNTALVMYQSGKIDEETLLNIDTIQNYKYARLFLIASARRKRRKDIENQMSVNEQNAQARQQAMQEQLAMEQSRKMVDARAEASIEKLKADERTQGQIEVKSASTQSKKDIIAFEKQLENQQPFR